MSEVAPGWAQANVGDLVRFNYGKGLPQRDRSGTGFPVYGSNGIVGRHRDALIHSEALVIGRKGSVGQVHHSLGPSWPIDTTYFVDTFSGMPPRFWYYALRDLGLDSLNRATAIPGLNREDAYRMELAVPPLPEQRRIADKLDTVLARVDACRERLDRVPAILKRFRQSVLVAATSGKLTEDWREEGPDITPAEKVLANIAEERQRQGLVSARRTSNDGGLGDAAPLPHGWAWCTVGQIADVRLGGTPSRKEPRYWNGDVPWVSSGEVANCRITDSAEKITQAGLAESNAKLYPRGSVLIAMIGEGKTRGQSAILDVEATTNQNSACLVFDGGNIVEEYVWFWALGEYERNRGEGRGGAQPALNGAKVRGLSVPLPPLEEQAEIVQLARRLLDCADRLERSLLAAQSNLEEITPSLLRKAFRGELVPQDPNDEPASLLLERIRAARTDQPKRKPGRRARETSAPRTSRKAAAMTKNRQDEDVKQKPYLAAILREAGDGIEAEDLFRRADLPLADFYKQLAWEVANGHIRDDESRLEVA